MDRQAGVVRDLQRAAGIGGGDGVGAGVEQVARLALAELGGGLGVQDVPDAGRAAAQLPLGRLAQLESRDLAQQLPRLGADALRVRQMTRILVCRAKVEPAQPLAGNLGEVLDNLASVIRDRFRVKRQIRVLTAHGRITGWILAAMPPALAGAMMVTTPSHLRMLVNDPLGVQMIIGALVLQVIGTLIIRKLVDIPY